MAEQQQDSGKIIQAIVEKLLPWHKIEWLWASQMTQSVRIRIIGIDVQVRIVCGGSFLVGVIGPNQDEESLYHARRLTAILNGAKRDDKGNLVTKLAEPWTPSLGDRVRVVKPVYNDSAWVDVSMDKFNLDVFIVKEVGDTSVKLVGCGSWNFRNEWLQLIEAAK